MKPRGPLPPNVHVVYGKREALTLLNHHAKSDIRSLPPDPKPLLKREPRRGPLAADAPPHPKWMSPTRSVSSALNLKFTSQFGPRIIEDEPARRLVERELFQLSTEIITPTRSAFGLLDIAGCEHLRIIVLYLQVGDHPSGLGQLLFRIYRAGGMVCGWAGEFPQGSPIVYWPHEAPVTFEEA